MIRRQRKLREVRLALWKIGESLPKVLPLLLQCAGIMLGVMALGILIAIPIVLGLNALWHFGQFTVYDMSGPILLVSIGIDLLMVRLGVWYFSDTEGASDGTD